MKLRALIAVAATIPLAALALVGCAPTEHSRALVNVPADASLTDAGRLVAPGGVILIAPGTYAESLQVPVSDVTVRGADRNSVVLDGGLALANGIVATGERAAVENLTVRNYLQNGVLVTGVTDENGAGIARGPDGYTPDAAPPLVPGYLVQHVTASNNGLYGIYAFNRTEGVIRDNLTTGGSDSGIYVGQCDVCNAVVQDNVVTANAVGIELANASAGLVITGNRIVGNRIGVSVLSNYLEAHGPSRGVQIVGNVIDDNNAERTPVQADGAFGIGIGLGGTRDAEVRANRIQGNRNVGVWITSSEDFAPTGNRITGNAFSADGLGAVVSAAPGSEGSGNCFDLGDGIAAQPAALAGLSEPGCASSPTPTSPYAQPVAPPGVPFSSVPLPGAAAGLPSVTDQPTVVPAHVELPDLTGVVVPPADLLAGVGA